MNELSLRLMSLANMVPPRVGVADIGSDHCLLPIYLARRGSNPYLQAIDNKKGPFLSMQKAVTSAGLDYCIELSLSSGLDCLSPKANLIVLAGMGGKLIQEILFKGKEKLDKVDYILIDAHRDLSSTRKMILELGYHIEDEQMIEEEGIFYSLILFKKGKQEGYTLPDFYFGPIIRKKKGEVFKKFLLENKKRILELLQKDLSLQARNHYDELLRLLNIELSSYNLKA